MIKFEEWVEMKLKEHESRIAHLEVVNHELQLEVGALKEKIKRPFQDILPEHW